jgi:hypothetical protein
MTNATNSMNTNDAATQMVPVYQVQTKPNGVWVDVDAEQYADYEKQLSRYQVRILYSAPGPISVPAIVLNQLRHRISEMREAAYTYGDYSKEAVDTALSGVLDTIDELEDAAPIPSEPDDETASNGWRRLAMQFDNHRMQALHHLRAMVQDSAVHMPHAIAFLSAGPLSGNVVLAERIAELAARMAPVQSGTSLSPDECFVALSWLSIARTRINFGAADEALLEKLGAICPSAAIDVRLQAEAKAEDRMQMVPPDVVRDSNRWRAFVGSGRIKPQGSAGLNAPMSENYAHMGLEIWTTYDRDYSEKLLAQMDDETARGRDWLTKYADVAVAAMRAAVEEGGALVCLSCWRFLGNPQDPLSQDCGGHCLQCMAEAGDPEAVAAVAALPTAS